VKHFQQQHQQQCPKTKHNKMFQNVNVVCVCVCVCVCLYIFHNTEMQENKWELFLLLTAVSELAAAFVSGNNPAI